MGLPCPTLLGSHRFSLSLLSSIDRAEESFYITSLSFSLFLLTFFRLPPFHSEYVSSVPPLFLAVECVPPDQKTERMSKIKDFKVKKQLGKGAFGDVYKVMRKSDGQYYALKKVNISSMSTREVADALNEIRLLASIRHPNIIGFMEAFLIESSMELCIVMEFADGGDLSAKVESHTKARRNMDEKQ